MEKKHTLRPPNLHIPERNDANMGRDKKAWKDVKEKDLKDQKEKGSKNAKDAKDGKDGKNGKDQKKGAKEGKNSHPKRPAFKSVTWATTALQTGKHTARKGSKSPDTPVNGRVASLLSGISLCQASRDGLVDIVQNILACGVGNLQDVDEDGFTALHHAARYNRSKVMEALLGAGADVNVKGGQDEMRPLHMACRYNNSITTQMLLARGADVNIKDIKGKTPLHYATRRGHDLATKMLLSVSKCDVNAVDSDYTTPLIMSAIQGNTSVCELLIYRAADIYQKDINDMTALMWAASEGHTAVAHLLLRTAKRHGRLKAYIADFDNEGNYALHLAVQNGSWDMTDLLLSHGADPNAQKLNLSNPLHVAAVNGYTEIAKLLLSRGAEVNLKDLDQMTPIHRAALYNRVDIIELLMKKGGDVNAKDKKNMSPLHCACWKGQTDAVSFLLDNGAQIAEVDSSLKTALHWTVQYGHYETLLVLLKHGASSLIDACDKNDQTVLHYAAYMGNVSVLKTILESGAKPEAKDQEERTPLHIAAQYDNVNCVEALIQASTHETNDDDVDGRTPLLLACMYGHHQVVQVLLSLGADVSKRDDEHCTAMMLAAAKGHSLVMRILMDNQASVNESDKMKNTALHYACAGGHVESVHLLLEKRAVVTAKNTYDHSALDLAIDNLHGEVAYVMLKHRSWRESLSLRGKDGRSVLDRLIAKLPESAMIVLDHCVERSSRDEEDPNLMMMFDYQYIDPGPDDIASKDNRYFALNTMVQYERDTLLSHPLCQNLLSQKWVKYGRSIFYVNLLIYLGYLMSLTFYIHALEPTDETRRLHNRSGCPINIPSHEAENDTFMEYYLANPDERPSGNRPIESKAARVFEIIITIFIAMFFIREVLKIAHQKWRYLLNFFNWIAWILLVATFTFIHSGGIHVLPCLTQWRAGWIAIFFAWINFIMYLRRIDLVGIYVIMFVTVLVSLLKAVLVFLFFSWAFAGSFFIVMSDNDAFQNIWTALINVFVMTLGEIEYIDNYLPLNRLDPFATDTHILLLIFLFLMPIVLMNLMIGIAVGDIEKVQHSAYLKRIALQVDLLYQIENGMPQFMQQKVYVRRATIKPNEDRTTWFTKLKSALFGSSRNVQFIEAEQKDKFMHALDVINSEMKHQQQRVRSLQLSVQQMHGMLSQICSKLDVVDPVSGIPEILSPVPPSEHGDTFSLYDNISIQRERQRSIRDPSDRPKSLHI